VVKPRHLLQASPLSPPLESSQILLLLTRHRNEQGLHLSLAHSVASSPSITSSALPHTGCRSNLTMLHHGDSGPRPSTGGSDQRAMVLGPPRAIPTAHQQAMSLASLALGRYNLPSGNASRFRMEQERGVRAGDAQANKAALCASGWMARIEAGWRVMDDMAARNG
jgi:hypothetical protein